MLRAAAQLTTDAQIIADWETSASLPAVGHVGVQLALRPMAGMLMPTEPGPRKRQPERRAASLSAVLSGVLCSGPSGSGVMTAAILMPFCPARSSASTAAFAGVQISARSGLKGTSVRAL